MTDQPMPRTVHLPDDLTADRAADAISVCQQLGLLQPLPAGVLLMPPGAWTTASPAPADFAKEEIAQSIEALMSVATAMGVDGATIDAYRSAIGAARSHDAGGRDHREEPIMKPILAQAVYYRGKLSLQAMRAAIVTATTDSLDPRGVEAGQVPPLDSDHHVHLWVFTPAVAGPNAASGGFAEFNVPCGEPGDDGMPAPGTWCWPRYTSPR